MHCRVFAVCIHFQEAGKKPIISSNQDQLARAWSRCSLDSSSCSHVLFTLLHALILAERIIEHVKIIRKFEKVMQLFDCCFCLKGTKCGSEATGLCLCAAAGFNLLGVVILLCSVLNSDFL